MAYGFQRFPNKQKTQHCILRERHCVNVWSELDCDYILFSLWNYESAWPAAVNLLLVFHWDLLSWDFFPSDFCNRRWKLNWIGNMKECWKERNPATLFNQLDCDQSTYPDVAAIFGTMNWATAEIIFSVQAKNLVLKFRKAIIIKKPKYFLKLITAKLGGISINVCLCYLIISKLLVH